MNKCETLVSTPMVS